MSSVHVRKSLKEDSPGLIRGESIQRFFHLFNLNRVSVKYSMCPRSTKLSAQGNIECFRKNLYKGIKLSLHALAQFTSKMN